MLTGMAQYGKSNEPTAVYERVDRCRLRLFEEVDGIGLPSVELVSLSGESLLKFWPVQIRTSAGCLHVRGRYFGKTHDLFFWPENCIPTDEQLKTMDEKDPADEAPPKT